MITFWNQLVEALNRMGQTHLPLSYLVNRYVELALAATLFMGVVLLFMKYLGYCGALRRVRREMMACTYRILLYRRHPRLVLRTEVHAIWCNGKYLVLLLPSLVFASLLYLMIHDTLANRYAFAPASRDETIVIRTLPLDGRRPLDDALLHSGDHSLPLTAQARIPGGQMGGSIWSRLEPTEHGLGALSLRGSAETSVQLNVGVESAPAMPRRIVEGVIVHIAYPPGSWWGMRQGWMVYFLLVSFLAALPLLIFLRIRL